MEVTHRIFAFSFLTKENEYFLGNYNYTLSTLNLLLYLLNRSVAELFTVSMAEQPLHSVVRF